MAKNLAKNCSQLERRDCESVVIDGGYRIGHFVADHMDRKHRWLFRDWFTGHVFALTGEELATAHPYPHAPIPDPK